MSVFLQGTCPKLDAPLNGRKLGKSHSVGHEVHFLCDPGYEIVGSESRVCQESLAWTGQQPTCQGLHRVLCCVHWDISYISFFSSSFLSKQSLYSLITIIFFILTPFHQKCYCFPHKGAFWMRSVITFLFSICWLLPRESLTWDIPFQPLCPADWENSSKAVWSNMYFLTNWGGF